MENETRSIGVLTFVLDRPLPPQTRVEIWLDSASQRWCIGPPRNLQSSSAMWQQVIPHEFFMAVIG